MSNHPNRNWRARMRQDCTDWLTRWILEHDPGGRLSELDQSRMRDAYQAGFEAGRCSLRPRPPEVTP
jgi:hypothetical protein